MRLLWAGVPRSVLLEKITWRKVVFVAALLIATMALATGLAVSQAGLIAFVGLVAPHLVRRSVIVTHGALLTLSALAGGVLWAN